MGATNTYSGLITTGCSISACNVFKSCRDGQKRGMHRRLCPTSELVDRLPPTFVESLSEGDPCQHRLLMSSIILGKFTFVSQPIKNHCSLARGAVPTQRAITVSQQIGNNMQEKKRTRRMDYA